MSLKSYQNVIDQMILAKQTLLQSPTVPPNFPHQFHLREYQQPFWDALEAGIKRAFIVWHRRCGKEKTCWNWMVKKAYEKCGNYYYMFPTYSQGKKILWDGKDKTGFRTLDHIPKEIIAKINNQEMKITLTNGSIIQVIGTENIDQVVGTNPVGVIFSEYPLQRPAVWDYIRPILAENEGWAIFNGTPRGKNHAYDLFITNQDNPKWFTQVLTVDDTKAISQVDLEEEKRSGMSEDKFQQEFYCSWDRGQEGSYYAKYLQEAELEGRICNIPIDPYIPVDTFWDLGIGDATSIIFAQRVQQEIRIIDYYESVGHGLEHYARVIKDKDYNYGRHHAPHDIQVRELTAGARTRLEVAKDMGISFNIVANLSIDEGISNCRQLFYRLWIDSTRCKYLLKCLENYHKQYIEKYNVYADQPVHDWSSHCADAFRMLGITYNKEIHSSGTKSVQQLEWEDRRYRHRT